MTTKHHHISLSYFVIFSSVFALCCFFDFCYSFRPRQFNLSTAATHWSSAGATWYGSPDGAGSDGGACGYGNLVSQAPFSSLVTGIGPSLQVREGMWSLLQEHPACSGKPVRVVITDFCPGGPCLSDSAHFDLCGTAFGAMAIPGEESKLRDAGVLQIRYSRVACDYSGKTIAFHVDQGSNPSYFAVVIEFEEGDGDLAGVDLRQTSSDTSGGGPDDNDDDQWWPIQQSWGAVWMLNAGVELQPPFSMRLTSKYSSQRLVARDVIPAGWRPGATYRSMINFL